jgi:hypothetical protein
VPKPNDLASALPPIAAEALKKLGEDLAIARGRRRESQRLWAARLGVSVPTLIRMEHGEPSVAIGVYVTALWMIGRTQALSALADPAHDLGALESDVRRAVKRRSVRRSASRAAHVARASKS